VKTAAFIIGYSAIFLIMMDTVMRYWSMPMITENFGLATMDIYNNRTLNMTESIATRIDGFEHLI
jgi:hypothetical protein